MLRIVIEYLVGASMLALGALFLIYISDSPTNVATNVIFLGAGFLIIRRAYQNSKKPIESKPGSKKVGNGKKNLNTKRKA
jgi:hypothetical protein